MCLSALLMQRSALAAEWWCVLLFFPPPPSSDAVRLDRTVLLYRCTAGSTQELDLHNLLGQPAYGVDAQQASQLMAVTQGGRPGLVPPPSAGPLVLW